MIESYTNSCLSCFRRCPREFELRYGQQFERASDDREVLQVGQTWHRAHDAASKRASELEQETLDKASIATTADVSAYAAINAYAPGELWSEKLRRLFVAYRWRWEGHPLKILSSEYAFEYELGGTTRRGQIDGIVEIDGAVGNLERKTSSEELAEGSPYWDRHRMGTQVSFYANAFKQLTGGPPAFTLLDVVRKPTIRPKSIVKKDAARLREELDSSGSASYYGESFPAVEVEAVLADGRESVRFYGARLTANIGERPNWYFARRVIPRTSLDLDLAERDTASTIRLIEQTDYFPRNPDACSTFGLCDFFDLCSSGETASHDHPPDGFRRRAALHPELPAKNS